MQDETTQVESPYTSLVGKKVVVNFLTGGQERKAIGELVSIHKDKLHIKGNYNEWFIKDEYIININKLQGE